MTSETSKSAVPIYRMINLISNTIYSQAQLRLITDQGILNYQVFFGYT